MAVYPDRTPVCLHDLFDDGQPQSRATSDAGTVDPVKTLPDPLTFLRGYPFTAVDNHTLDLTFCGQPLQRQRHAAGSRRMFERIVEQIGQHTPQLGCIPLNKRKIGRRNPTQFHLSRRKQRTKALQNLCPQLYKVHLLQLQPIVFHSRQIQQLFDQFGQPLGFLADHQGSPLPGLRTLCRAV